MDYKTLHAWNLEPAAAKSLQIELALQVKEEPFNVGSARLVTCTDMSFAGSEDQRTTPVFAGMVSLHLPELTIVERVGVQTISPFPYVTGLLSFREVPPLLEVWRKLRERPDAVITDGQGRAHPRRFGLACHLGLLLDVPTVGVAKTRLIGTHDEVPNTLGGWTPLIDRDEIIGAVLRARCDAAPVYVSVGHRIDLPSAIALVQRCLGKTRVPEPTRQAHLYVNSIRRDPTLLEEISLFGEWTQFCAAGKGRTIVRIISKAITHKSDQKISNNFMKLLGLLLLSIMLGVTLTACGNGTNSAVTPQVYAQLRGTQERPTQVATAATGAVTVTATNSTTLHLDITTKNLVGVTSATLNVGKPGSNGPAIFTLYTAAGNSNFPASFHQDLTAATLIFQPTAGINSFSDAVNAVTVTGNTYVNISTQANPGGELRGQIGAASFAVTPVGTAVVPSVTSTAIATATVQLNSKQSVLTVTVTGGSNLQNVSHIGIYIAPPGGNGPQLFTVFDSAADGIFPGSATRTLTMTDLQTQTTSGVTTYADAVNAFLSGNTYLQISTTAHPNGELRAQLLSQQ